MCRDDRTGDEGCCPFVIVGAILTARGSEPRAHAAAAEAAAIGGEAGAAEQAAAAEREGGRDGGGDAKNTKVLHVDDGIGERWTRFSRIVGVQMSKSVTALNPACHPLSV